MRIYSEVAIEKANTGQGVILRTYPKRISWLHAAEILGIRSRHLRRIKQNYEQFGFPAIRGIDSLEPTNRFLETEYIKEFYQRFSVSAEETGTDFIPCLRTDLERIFSLQTEWVVNKDNTFKFKICFCKLETKL